MGAPLNNQNAIKTGSRRSLDAARAGFRSRRLPRGFKYVAEESSRYAGALYETIKTAFGSVNREQMEIIESAAAWQQHALYVLRVLRIDHDALKPETRVQLEHEIAKATQKRVDLVKLLKLNGSESADPFQAIFKSHDGQSEVQARSDGREAATADIASAAGVGDCGTGQGAAA